MKKLGPAIVHARLVDAVETKKGMELTFARVKKNGRIALRTFKRLIPYK